MTIQEYVRFMLLATKMQETTKRYNLMGMVKVSGLAGIDWRSIM